MKKYFVALALVCMTSLVFAGCAGTEQTETPADSVDAEEVVLPEVSEEETAVEETEEAAEEVVSEESSEEEVAN